MSIVALLAMTELPGSLFVGKTSALAVLGRLCHHHNCITQACFPSYETIAAGCGVSVRSVATGIAQLKELALIVEGRNPIKASAPTKNFILRFVDPRARDNDMQNLHGGHPLVDMQNLQDRHAESAHKPERVTREGEEDIEPPISPIPASATVASVAKAIWDSIPKPDETGDGINLRSRAGSVGDIEVALKAAVKRRQDPERILAAFHNYWADPDTQREGYRFAKGAQRLIAKDRWTQWAPSGDTQTPARQAQAGGRTSNAGDPLPPEEESPLGPVIYPGPGGFLVRRDRVARYLKEFYSRRAGEDRADKWDHAKLGPPPGAPGCLIPPEFDAIYAEKDIEKLIRGPVKMMPPREAQREEGAIFE